MTDEQKEEYEDGLQELLGHIDGSKTIFGPGMRTYTADEPNQQKLHEACLELERRGKIIRYNEEDNWVLWKPK